MHFEAIAISIFPIQIRGANVQSLLSWCESEVFGHKQFAGTDMQFILSRFPEGGKMSQYLNSLEIGNVAATCD